MCLSTFYLFIFFYVFFNAFLPKITLAPWQGVGGGGWGVVECSFVGMATGLKCDSGPKSDAQWAKMWRTRGWKVTHGPKCNIGVF